MDYCSSCRRHLNGALVCPGCGAYAPDIDPSAADGGTGPALATAAAHAAPAAWDHPAATGTWHDGTVWDETTRTGTPETHGAGSPDAYDSPGTGTAADYEERPQGRAARRRQMARWKKNQRRAVVATAVALVGGGLTVAALNGNATPGVRAATAPEDTTMGGTKGEAPTFTEPTSEQYDTPRSSPTTPPHSGRASRHQQTRTADPRTTPTDTRTDAAATPRELPLTTPQRRSTAPSTTDTVTGTAGSSASKATEPTTPPAAETQPDTQQPAAPATPPPTTSTQPPASSDSDPQSKELCLLVICLG
ncbi:SCO2400 family protein [Streptomyces olindensis]|uniref:SCO2400 family protein n=1 Tax=Streptomyces olindensis TaxID=358823 RepID=UPI0033F0FBE0